MSLDYSDIINGIWVFLLLCLVTTLLLWGLGLKIKLIDLEKKINYYRLLTIKQTIKND